MNSFVRNELQVLYACIDDPEKTRIATAKHSVERMDWALREMLPGGHSLADAPLDEFGEHSGERIKREQEGAPDLYGSLPQMSRQEVSGSFLRGVFRQTLSCSFGLGSFELVRLHVDAAPAEAYALGLEAESLLDSWVSG
jgi:hypothetical protein